MWSLFRNVSVAFIKPSAAEAFGPQAYFAFSTSLIFFKSKTTAMQVERKQYDNFYNFGGGRILKVFQARQ
jgi:hypothetical protein